MKQKPIISSFFNKYGYLSIIILAVFFLSLLFPPHFSSQIYAENTDNADAYDLILQADSYIHSFGVTNISYLYDYDNTSFHSNIYHHTASIPIQILSNKINFTQKRFYSKNVDLSIPGEYFYDPNLHPLLVHFYSNRNKEEREVLSMVPGSWKISLLSGRQFDDRYGGFIIDVYRIDQGIENVFPDPYFTIHGTIDYQNRTISSSGEAGVVVFGPYALLPPGDYRVSYLIDGTNPVTPSNTSISLVVTEYFEKQSSMIATRQIPYAYLNTDPGTSVDLNFPVGRKAAYQFIVIDDSGSRFVVRNITLRKIS